MCVCMCVCVCPCVIHTHGGHGRCRVLVAQPNIVVSTSLLPPKSVVESLGLVSFRGGVWVELHGHSVNTNASSLCIEGDGLVTVSSVSGLTSGLGSVAVDVHPVDDHTCGVSMSCEECSLAAVAEVVVSLPWEFQVVSWKQSSEIAGAEVGTRRFLCSTLSSAAGYVNQTRLELSVTPSVYVDERKDTVRTGYTTDFTRRTVVTTEDLVSSSSRHVVSVTLRRTDVVLQTEVSVSQSPLQLAAVILSAVVSIVSAIRGGYSYFERGAEFVCCRGRGTWWLVPRPVVVKGENSVSSTTRR